MPKRLLLIGFLLANLASIPSAARAAPVCACYFGQKNDCRTEAISDAANAQQQCENACQTRYADQYTSHRFEDDAVLGFSIIAECEKAHALSGAKPVSNPVTPRLQVDIPGINFSPIRQVGSDIQVNFLGEYLSGLYQYLIGISTIIAIVFIMVGGLQYAFGAVAPGQVSKAKERIKNGVIGLILLLCAVLIVETVNPELARFDPLTLRFAEEIPLVAKEDPGDAAEEDSIPDVQPPTGGRYFAGASLCSSPGDCVKWCDEHPDKATWPTANRKTVDPSLTKMIPDVSGVKNVSRSRATEEFIELLTRAGEIAVTQNPEYTIYVHSAYRPLEQQIKLVCDRVKSQDPTKIADIGKTVAYPGSSYHGSGLAMDIRFHKGKEAITGITTATQNLPKFEEGAEMLADIMASAGFVRYGRETWHFEVEGKTTSTCRCKGASECPFPATCKF